MTRFFIFNRYYSFRTSIFVEENIPTMRKVFLLLSVIGVYAVQAQDLETQPLNTDAQLMKLLEQYRNEINQLKHDKESLQQTIKLHEDLINSIQSNNNYTTNTKWNTITNNLTYGMESYRQLNDKIQMLKTVSKTATYVSYTNSLSGISNNPLGFSFEEKILSSYKNNFNDKKKTPKFAQIIQSITSSPLVQLVPIASQASTITSSVLNILYTNETTNSKSSELESIQKFEKELSKYLKYFNDMNVQNQQLNTNNEQYVKSLEEIQLDMVKDLMLIRQQFGLQVRERNVKTESIDAYLNYLLNDLTSEYVNQYISSLKSKHKNNYDKLLQSEPSILSINNNLDDLEDYAHRFKNTYDFYTSFNKSYVSNLTKVVNDAKADAIIEAKNNKTADQIHQEVINKLNAISDDYLKQLDEAIKVNQLNNSINKINYIKFL